MTRATPSALIDTRSLLEVEADGLAIGSFEGERPNFGSGTPLSDAIASLVDLGDFKGKPFETVILYPVGLRVPRVVLVGLGKRSEFGLEKARRAAGRAATRLRDLGAKRIAISPPGAPGQLGWVDAAGAAVEGAMLALYGLYAYRTEKVEELNMVSAVAVVVPAETAPQVKQRVDSLRIISESVVWIRDLVNHPGNVVTAGALADAAKEMAQERAIRCEILELDDIRRLGMGCIVGVNAGSFEPARVVTLAYDGPNAPQSAPIALVGKGITFDSGGICLKPRAGMEQLKDDMAGGAAVLGTLRAAADLQLPVRLVGIVPMTDNMPGSAALKPGDVLRGYAGLTVEVVDTDAEGRLVLADALAYAIKEFQPRAILDVATLTGSIFIALGHHATGLFCNDERMAKVLTIAGECTGERVWRMPLWPEHEDLIDSDIADIRNQGVRGDSDAIAAAVFLKRFVNETPWAHLDIAGTSWAEKKRPYIPKGATGVGVRLLIEALQNGL